MQWRSNANKRKLSFLDTVGDIHMRDVIRKRDKDTIDRKKSRRIENKADSNRNRIQINQRIFNKNRSENRQEVKWYHSLRI